MLNKNPYSRLCDNFNELTFKELAPKLLLSEDRFKVHDSQIYNKAKKGYKSIQEDI